MKISWRNTPKAVCTQPLDEDLILQMISRKNKVKLVLEGKKINLTPVCGRASVFSYICLFCFFNQSATRRGLLMLTSYLGILSRQCHYVLKLELNLARLLSAHCCWERRRQLGSSSKTCAHYQRKCFSWQNIFILTE